MTNTVLGRGKVYFEPEGENGEDYFGNTPAFSLNRTSQVLDHYSSDEGVKVLDNSVMLSVDEAVKFETDEISAANLARWFLGSTAADNQSTATGVTEDVTVTRGRWFQLGTTTSRPEGITGIASLVIEDAGSTTITASGNYQADLVNARVYIEPDAPDIADDEVLTFTYNKTAVTKDRVIAERNMLYGALRFISSNPAGTEKNFYWPRVALSPDGDYALKGDDWQKIAFNAKVLVRDTSTKSAYVTSLAT